MGGSTHKTMQELSKSQKKKCTQQFVYSTINLRVRKMQKIHEKATMLTQTGTYFSTRASGPRRSTAEFCRVFFCFVHLLSVAPLPPPMHPFMNTGTVTWSKQGAEHTKARPYHATWYPRSATRRHSTPVDRVGSGV